MEGVQVKTEEVVADSACSFCQPQPIPGLHDIGPPPFLTKTFDMVEDPSTDSIVSWSHGRNSFVVWDAIKLATALLPKYFKHSNFSSFIRQLNTYGFRKVDPDRWEFANEGFLGGQRHLLKNIKRRRHASQGLQQQVSGPCVELGKFEPDDQIDRLKRDGNVLRVEVVKLKQQQQASITQLVAMEKRLQGTERKQKQIMAFLVEALKNPTLFHQLIQCRNPKKVVDGVPKKRRLASTESQVTLQQVGQSSPHGSVNPLLSIMDNESAASCGNEVAINTIPPNDGGYTTWKELLNEELMADGVSYQLNGSQTDTDLGVRVDDLRNKTLDWDNDVEIWVGEMGFLSSASDCTYSGGW